MVSFPYYSHIFRDSYGSGMGIVWVEILMGIVWEASLNTLMATVQRINGAAVGCSDCYC